MDWFRGHVYAPGDEKQMLIKLFHLPPVRGGSVELLRDGEATYERLVAEIVTFRQITLASSRPLGVAYQHVYPYGN